MTVITILTHMHGVMPSGLFWLFLCGAAISLVFGLSIPTVKLVVGLGRMQFKMPVGLVSYVNTGILLSGIALFCHVLGVGTGMLLGILACASAFIAFLCLVGILANLKDAKVHWVIEISNVVCQMSVAVATILLFF